MMTTWTIFRCAGVQGISVVDSDTPAWRTTAPMQIFLTTTLDIAKRTIQRELHTVSLQSGPKKVKSK